MSNGTLMLGLAAVLLYDHNRKKYVRDVEMDIYHHVGHRPDLEPVLERAVRLPLKSFELLCSVLEDSLRSDDEDNSMDDDDNSSISSDDDSNDGWITPASKVYLTLRWLTSGDLCVGDVMLLFGIHSQEEFFKIVWSTIHAMIASDDPVLDTIHFPKTREELNEAAAGFRSATIGPKHFVVSAIDGWFVEIQKPSVEDNKRTYGWLYSTYYQRYGLNIQAAVDSNYQFQFVGVAGTASMSDTEAIGACKLQQMVDKIPLPYVCLADAGYTATDALATLFTSHRAGSDPRRKAFNEWARPLLDRAPTAMGMLVETFRVLQQPLTIELENVWRLLVAVARLHNFRIDQGVTELKEEFDDEFDDDDDDEDLLEKARQQFVPSQPQRKDGRPIAMDSWLAFPFEAGESSRRNCMVLEMNEEKSKQFNTTSSSLSLSSLSSGP